MVHSYIIFVLCVLVTCDAIAIHRSRRASATSDVTVPGYKPYSKPYKYSEVQINPVNGPPIQFRDVKPPYDKLPIANLSPDSLRQLQILQYVAAYVPEADQLDESTFIPLLPYINTMSEDSLQNIQSVIRESDDKNVSKVSKIIKLFLAMKEKKLKPIKRAMKAGADLLRKKMKSILRGLSLPFKSDTTTQAPFAIIPGTVSVLDDEPQSAYIASGLVQDAAVPIVADNRFVQFYGTQGGSYYYDNPSLASSYQTIVIPDKLSSSPYGYESPLITQYNQYPNQNSLVSHTGADLSSFVNTNSDLTFSASENVEKTRYDNASLKSPTEKNGSEKEKNSTEMGSLVNSEIKSTPISSTKSPLAALVYPGTTNTTPQST